MDSVWWERVPNALAFVNDITESLLAEKSIIIHSAQSIPWYDSMCSQVKDAVMLQNYSKRFEMISETGDPGPYLLREFCKPEKRAAYRPTKTFESFFAESDDIVLHERYIWVKVDSAEDLDRWTKFVSSYLKERGKGREKAVFVLEWQGEMPTIFKKGIRTISFDEYINEYDRIVFSTLASSTIKEAVGIKNYLAELAAFVTENDIELCAMCLSRYKEFLQNPFHTVSAVIETDSRDSGESFEFSRSEPEVANGIWMAQIKTIYPIIEEFRGKFVESHSESIARELPITSAYGEIYEDPKDVELGTLVFMAKNGKLQLNTREYFRLEKFKDARNKLSHLNVLSIDEIRELYA